MQYPESQSDAPLFPERDEQGSGDLPTYDDLATQHGPNSRFGRWRQWIEKRAAERYADLTQEELQRRRGRGWGEGVPVGHEESSGPSAALTGSKPLRPLSAAPQLHITTDFHTSVPSLPLPPEKTPSLLPEPSPPATLIPEVVSPSRLKLYQFGSRFLPHTTAPIRCLLPLLNDQILLIGHDQGLSVLNMFPRDWTDDGLAEKGPAEAEVRPVWVGEVVYQMSILETESTGQGTPQGVVLALVGPVYDESSKDPEGIRTLRMYSLASLVSLAKWAIAQKGQHPLNLRQAGYSYAKHSLSKRHRQQTSITKGLRSLVIESPIAQAQTPLDANSEPQASYSDIADAPMYSKRLPPRPSERAESVDSQSSWDAMDELHDLPLLWAAHYNPLASPGSRLHNTSVLFYEKYQNENQRSRGGVLLAVATKSNIFLYEAPKGERAFHLVKEFYTPLTARCISFVEQSVSDSMSRSVSDVSPRKLAASRDRHSRVVSLGPDANRYPNQPSLFVIFEKKAGLIRIADSAVGEVDLYEESNGLQHLLYAGASSPMARRSRTSWDGRGFTKEHKGIWISPTRFNIPSAPGSSSTSAQSMYVLTRGRLSHVLPHPLPPCISAVPPYRVLLWSSPPTNVSCRVCVASRDENGPPPFLQVIAFCEGGLEVQEVALPSLSQREGKGKRRDDQSLRASVDIGGDTGLLCTGGYWSRPYYAPNRSNSVESYTSATSDGTWSPQTVEEKLRAHQGIYGWVRKGLEDWRVFWVGGTGAEQEGDDECV